MTVDELIDLFVDELNQKFIIYDTELGKDVFEGCIADMPEEFREYEISSIDNIEVGSDTITINI